MFEGKKVKVLLSQAGSGKGMPVTSKILTKNGFIMLKDLKLYDRVISPVDGKEYSVTGIYNRGYRHVNKVTFTNRTSILFDDEHLWAIQSDADRCAGKPFTVVTAEELKNTPLHRQAGKWRKHLLFIPVSCPVEFQGKDLPMPYALGLFISDGSTVARNIVIAEEDVKRKFEDDIKECGSYIKPLKKKYNYYLYNFRSFKNKFSFFGTHSYNKFIPKEYLYASLETRRKLLAGLIDGDGTVSSSGKIDFDSTSEQLIEDITFLVSSLGGVVTKKKEKTGKYKKDGNTIICRSVYRITFWLPEGVILSEKHTKRLNSCTKQRRPYKAIESIEDAGFAECMCIYIDSPDHLFITDDWIVTHNTRALMTEIENELKTRRSEEIAFVTYTKKGVEEGVRRACNAMNLAPDDLPYFCTLHALTFRALGYKRDQVFNRIQQNKFNKKYGYNLNVCEVSSRYNVHPTKDTEYFNIYEAIRSGSITSEQYASSEIDMEYLHHFAHDYEEFKAQECLTDFTDCLIHYVQNGVTLPVKVAMVDECFSPETEVRMADGSIKEIKNIKIGDKVQGTKGVTTVISKHEGVDDMYNVIANKNKVLFTCNSQHLLKSTVTNNWKKAEKLKRTQVYFKRFEGVEKSFYLDPYFFGLWLGNGFSREAVVVCNNKDIETINWLKNYGESLGDKVILRNRKGIVQVEYSVKLKGRALKCEIRKRLESLGFLLAKTKENTDGFYLEKHIPDEYLNASVKQRLCLLAGIIDSDGMLVKAGNNKKYRVEMSRKKLMQDIYNLVASLGFNPTWYVTHHTTNNIRREYYRIDFYGTKDIPTLLKRKKSKLDTVNKSVNCRVEFANKSNYVGITVDSEDSLFVLANGCVVHNCQDITALQWKVIELAFAKAEKIFIAGDENQCLYTYNGARPDFLINFAKQFPTEYLSISHRIPKQVYYLAKGIVDLIDDKTEKPFDMKKENVNGKIVQIDNFERLLNFIDVDNLEDKKETEWYIICRNNCYLEEPKDILEENLIPYWTSDGFFMDGEILRRIKDYYNFGLKGYKTEKKKKEFAERFNIVDFNLPFTESNLFTEHKKFIYYNFVECYGLEKLEEMCKWNPQILVSSIHHVKGGEARNVALLLDTTRKVDINLYNKIDEELRVLYVAVTRTKENLILIDSSHGEGYGKIIETVKEENGLEW